MDGPLMHDFRKLVPAVSCVEIVLERILLTIMLLVSLLGEYFQAFSGNLFGPARLIGFLDYVVIL
jgi:hypothetical protein